MSNQITASARDAALGMTVGELAQLLVRAQRAGLGSDQPVRVNVGWSAQVKTVTIGEWRAARLRDRPAPGSKSITSPNYTGTRTPAAGTSQPVTDWDDR